MRFSLLLLICLVMASACGSLSGDNVSGTLQAGTQIYATEVAAMLQTDVIRQTEVVSTVQMLETQSAEISSVNDQLYATLAVGSTPTPTLAVGQAPPDTSGSDLMGEMLAENQRWFFKTGVSTAVNESDGCVVNPGGNFSQSEVEQLYATVQVVNIQSGTPMRAEWHHEGELVTADDWTVPWNAQDVCLWFVIDRNDTNFPPGAWSVTLFADGFQLEQPMLFNITE